MSDKKDKTGLKIAALVVAFVAVVVAVVVGIAKVVSSPAKAPAPVVVADECHYESYEIRTGEIYLYYHITLKNTTGADIDSFALRAVFEKDHKSGYLLGADASVKQKFSNNSVFSIKNGETKSFELAFVAPYYKNKKEFSKELPEMYIIYPDGSEGEIQEN
ncbi:MAG: hypothetical protein IJB86_07965 [Clostridia bacterium]|nr:hypothetical protein [Clostridia bacterium]